MSAAHTPGPWSIEQTRDMLWVGPMRPDDRKVEHVVVSLNIDSQLTHSAALRQLYNARLIAAAPELLTQLEYAVKLLGAFAALNGTAQVQSMRDTIAKATGADQ